MEENIVIEENTIMKENLLWLGKPYYSLDAYCKMHLGHKCYKIALDAGMTCPNRDGALGRGGCIFCSSGGSGDFAVSTKDRSVSDQLREGLSLMGGKQIGSHYIAYFQSYTNTYAPLDYLEEVYTQALDHPQVCGISIATRPDCLADSVLSLLKRLQEAYSSKFIWVELGLQTIHEDTATFIRRGYSLSVFEKAYDALTALGIPVILHLILGLPGESPEEMYQTVSYLNRLLTRGDVPSHLGVKLQLLHVLKGTDLASLYEKGEITVLEEDEYLEILIHCLELLSPHIVIHRVTGDGPRELLLAPGWSRNKRHVLNRLHRTMKTRSSFQGRLYSPESASLQATQI